ncbi:hypothetical protein KTO58_01740 [Chitinophaga pendula]|uniref:hypothetical protein n=1 Tax=Chitinophaga TaxID=79328 RepID=UPI0012FD4E25|nr:MULTISPECIES: hypothetical protein [Chitinophaga]UCJ07927.1 hypothetical protein KTO58_01740 [Chitinophaga pendula]
MKSQRKISSFSGFARTTLSHIKGGGTGLGARLCEAGSMCIIGCKGYGCFCHPIERYCVWHNVGGR